MADTEPTVALDDIEGIAGKYLTLRELRGEMAKLKKEERRLLAAIQRAVGDAHVATFYGEAVITNRPIDRFRGEDFRSQQPILAKEYTKPVLRDELDLEGLERDHPVIFAQYRSRQFKILDV